MLTANLTIRFLLELGALGAISAWGFSAGTSTGAHVVFGVGLPLLLAAFWAAFVSPGASTPDATKVVLAFVVFAAAAAALLALQRPALAAGYIAVAAVNAAFLQVLEN